MFNGNYMKYFLQAWCLIVSAVENLSGSFANVVASLIDVFVGC